MNLHDVSVVGEVGRVIVERPYADWLSARFCSSSSVFAAPSRPKVTEGWLLEREKREKRMPPIPFPMLAAPKLRNCGWKREREREKKNILGRMWFRARQIMVVMLFPSDFIIL